MERMQESAIRMADYLRNHEKITWIFYPGYEDHPMYYLVGKDKQMRGPGALMSFGVKGGLKGAKTLLDNVKLNTLAVSLGGVESLIQSPALMTHAGVPKEEREKAGIKDELVRYSIGIEEFEDLRSDMEQALAKI